MTHVMSSDITNSSHLSKDSSHYVHIVTVTLVLSPFWATLCFLRRLLGFLFLWFL